MKIWPKVGGTPKVDAAKQYYDARHFNISHLAGSVI